MKLKKDSADVARPQRNEGRPGKHDSWFGREINCDQDQRLYFEKKWLDE